MHDIENTNSEHWNRHNGSRQPWDLFPYVYIGTCPSLSGGFQPWTCAVPADLAGDVVVVWR